MKNIKFIILILMCVILISCNQKVLNEEINNDTYTINDDINEGEKN